MSTTRKPQIESSTITMPEIAAMIDINLVAAYALARQPGFPALRIGKRIIVPRVAFEKWLERAASKQEIYAGKNH